MSGKKSDPFKFVVIFIAAGALVGVLTGVFCVAGDIPEEAFFAVINASLKICIGLMVLIVDLLCVWALLRPFIYNHIDRTGGTTYGKIEDVTVFPYPNQPDVDEWLKKVRYSCTVTYTAGGKTYKKEFSPSALISKRELYPLEFEKGNDVRIKYSKSHPSMSMLDIDVLKSGMKNERKRSRIIFALFAVVITIIYIVTVL